MTTDNDDEIDYNAPTRQDKIGQYLVVICGLLVLGGGIYLTVLDESSSGWSPGGRFNKGSSQTINGPTAILIGCIILIIPFFRLIAFIFKDDR